MLQPVFGQLLQHYCAASTEWLPQKLIFRHHLLIRMTYITYNYEFIINWMWVCVFFSIKIIINLIWSIEASKRKQVHWSYTDAVDAIWRFKPNLSHYSLKIWTSNMDTIGRWNSGEMLRNQSPFWFISFQLANPVLQKNDLHESFTNQIWFSSSSPWLKSQIRSPLRWLLRIFIIRSDHMTLENS